MQKKEKKISAKNIEFADKKFGFKGNKQTKKNFDFALRLYLHAPKTFCKQKKLQFVGKHL